MLFNESFLKLRNSYIVRQRNFNLTFTAGIFTYLNIILGFVNIINYKFLTKKKKKNIKIKKYFIKLIIL